MIRFFLLGMSDRAIIGQGNRHCVSGTTVPGSSASRSSSVEEPRGNRGGIACESSGSRRAVGKGGGGRLLPRAAGGLKPAPTKKQGLGSRVESSALTGVHRWLRAKAHPYEGARTWIAAWERPVGTAFGSPGESGDPWVSATAKGALRGRGKRRWPLVRGAALRR